MQWGVGIIGAGPGASALHAPTLDRLRERFRIVHIADNGSGRAEGLAVRFGARASSGVTDLLADPAVDVVAICSPPSEHADQIRASVAAGARAILCEKPLGTTVEDVRSAVDTCRRAGVPLLVATNHFYDEAWDRAKHHLFAEESAVRSITVSVALPPNGRYHGAVTEIEPTHVSARNAPDLTEREAAAAVVRQLVLGLAIHDLPAVRDLAPDLGTVDFAEFVAPIGYTIGFRSSGIPILLTAVMVPDGADAMWRLTVHTSADRVDVEFPPAFVHAGSATVSVRHADLRYTTYPRVAEDGYVGEWLALAALLDRSATTEYHELLDDALFAIALADSAADAVRRGSES